MCEVAPSLPLFMITSGRRSPGWASGARKKYPGSVVSWYPIRSRSPGAAVRSTTLSQQARCRFQMSSCRCGSLACAIR
jgi:hypothetical protein